MKIIGITGKSGSGKTTFASSLAKKLNGMYIDIDKIGHEALYRKDILDKLCREFGSDILENDGKVNRKKVGAIVFANPDKMQILTDLTWEFMQEQLDRLLAKNYEFIILDWILLPTSKYWDMCDYTILVKSDELTRKNKVMTRDNISEEYYNKRDSASIDYSNLQFNYIFENDYQINSMIKALDDISNYLV